MDYNEKKIQEGNEIIEKFIGSQREGFHYESDWVALMGVVERCFAELALMGIPAKKRFWSPIYGYAPALIGLHIHEPIGRVWEEVVACIIWLNKNEIYKNKQNNG